MRSRITSALKRPWRLTLRASAEADAPGPLFAIADVNRCLDAMRESIVEIQQAMETLDMGSPWSASAKVSDDFLTPLFRTYFQKLNLPNLMSKKSVLRAG